MAGHAAGSDAEHQRVKRISILLAVSSLELGSGEPAHPRHVDPIDGGVEVPRHVGPQVFLSQAPGQGFLLRGGDQAAPEQAVADHETDGQLVDRGHKAGFGLPAAIFQKAQIQHVLDRRLSGSEGQAKDQFSGPAAVHSAQHLAGVTGQVPVGPHRVPQLGKMDDTQLVPPRIVHDIILKHDFSPHFHAALGGAVRQLLIRAAQFGQLFLCPVRQVFLVHHTQEIRPLPAGLLAIP